MESKQKLKKLIKAYKNKLKRLMKLQQLEPNNEYHDWDKEIKQCKMNIFELNSDFKSVNE